MRKERGPRLARAGSSRTAWQRSGLWEVEGLRGVGGSGDIPCHSAVPPPMAGPHPPCSEASCSLQSPLHWHPLAASRSLNKAVKLVPAGLWAHSGGRQLGCIHLSISLFFPYHQQSLLLILKGDGIRILSVTWALQSVCSHSLPPSHLLWLGLMGKLRICRIPRKGCSQSYDEMDIQSQWISECMASVWVTCKVQLPTWGR